MKKYNSNELNNGKLNNELNKLSIDLTRDYNWRTDNTIIIDSHGSMIDKAFILPSNCNILTYTKMGESLPELFKSNSKCNYHDSRYTNINVPLYNKGSNKNKVLLDKTYNDVKPHIYLNDDIFYDIEFNFTFKNEKGKENKLHGITSYSDYSNLNIQNMYHNCNNDNFELFKIPIINLLSLEPYSTLMREIFYTDSLQIEYPDIDTFNIEFLLPFLELLSHNDIVNFNDIKEKNEIFNSYRIKEDFKALLIDVNYNITLKQILKKGTIIYYDIKTYTFMFIYRYLYAYVRVPGLVPCGTYITEVYVNVCTVHLKVPGTGVLVCTGVLVL